jgi:hypothetical protein
MTRPFLVTEWVVELVELELSIEITACTGFEDFWPFQRRHAEPAAAQASGIKRGCGTCHDQSHVTLITG